MTTRPRSGQAIEIRSVRPREEDPLLLELFREGFSSARAPELLQWKYWDNPAGPAEIALACVDGVAAAMACLLPVRMRVGTETLLGSQSVDVLTRPAYRGRGLYPAAAESLWRRAASEGVALTFGFTNRASTRLTLERLGRREVAALPLRVRPLRPFGTAVSLARRALSGRMPEAGSASPLGPGDAPEPRRPIVQLRHFDARFNALWGRLVRHVDVAVVRNRAYLEWRYAQHPEHPYEILALEGADGVRGYLVWRLLDRFGLRTAFVADAAAEPDDAAAVTELLQCAADRARMHGAHLVALLSWPGSPVERACRAFTFPVPSGLFPQTNVFSVISHRSPIETLRLAEPSRWWLSWGDSDVV